MKHRLKLPKPTYVCQRCGLRFEREKPGPTECPACEHLYVDWVNYEVFAKVLREMRKQGLLD